MTISKEERAEWRKLANGRLANRSRIVNRPWELETTLGKALDALESAEARAEAAERERDVLADKLSILGPDCPREIDEHFDILCSYRENPSSGDIGVWCYGGGKECWLEWARQQARGGEI